jgi:MSHA biogenesis protein MshL
MLRLTLTAVVILGVASGAGQLPVSRPPVLPPQGQPPPSGLPVTQLDPGASGATLDSPRRLALHFAGPTPIQDVLKLLVEGTPFSLALDPDTTGTFRGDLKNLTLREALTAVLTPLALDFEVRGTVIRVTIHRTETRQFDLNLLNVQRALNRTTGEANATIATTTQAEDVFARIEEGVRGLLSSAGQVHVDRHAGLAQVTDVPERIDRVALYLEALQVRTGRQVRLEARAFEVTLKSGAAIDWQAVRNALGVPANAAVAGLAVDPAALQKALDAQGETRLLWAPETNALNNEPALVRMATGGVSSLALTIVPQIAADGVVQLSIAHSWEEHAGDRKAGWTKSVPYSRTAETDTVMRVADGSTVMMTGLVRTSQVAEQAKGKGVAAMFGAQTKRTAYTELVVLLRPTVVSAGTRN